MSEYKVLVPLDGSRVAEHSLIYLDALKNMGDLKVKLIAVVDRWMEAGPMSPADIETREMNLLSTYLREVSSDLKRHSSIEVEGEVIPGAPAATIVQEAAAYQPDLIVVATHGRSGISRWRLGSVADKVIRGVSSDVLVVGPKSTEHERWMEGLVEAPFRSVLVPLDGSPLAEAAIEKATAIATAYGSDVHLVRAVPLTYAMDGMAGQASYVPDLLDSLIEGAQAYLDEVKAAHPALADARTDVLPGQAIVVLEDYIREHDIDLVVMTSHGRSGFIRTALGSVTDRLLANGMAPVLVVRSQVAAEPTAARELETAGQA